MTSFYLEPLVKGFKIGTSFSPKKDIFVFWLSNEIGKAYNTSLQVGNVHKTKAV